MIEQFLRRDSVLGSVTNLLISAGTLSSNRSDVTFANSNGITFGLNTNGVVTASVGAGGGGAGTGFTTATTAGTNIVGTLGGGGLSMGVPAYLTTAMASNAATISNINVSAGTTSNNLSAVTFSNSNNVSFGLNASTITASVTVASTQGSINLSAGTTSNLASAFTFSNSNNVSFGLNASTITASIATTYAGTGFTTATTAGTNIVGTLNTSGLSLGVPAYLTTAMQSNAATISNINVSAGTTSNNLSAITFSNSNNVSFGLNGSTLTASIATTYAGTGFTTATTAGTAIVGTLNTSGLSMGVPAFLTTAMQSNAATISNIKISAGTLSQTRSDVTFGDSNGVSWGLNTNGIVTASIATTYAGTGFTTATTAGTAIVGTLNTSGLSMGVPAFLTTADLSQNSSKYAGTGFTTATTAGTAIVGTLNTSGLSMGVPAYITTAAPSSALASYWANQDRFIDDNSTTLRPTASVLQVLPFIMPYAISGNFLRMPVLVAFTSTESLGTTANTTFTVNRTHSTAVGIYTQLAGASSVSLGQLTSTAASWVIQYVIGAGAVGSQYTETINITYPISGTTSQFTTSSAQSSANIGLSTNQLTNFTSARFHDIPFAISLPASNYWAAFGITTTTATTGGLSAFWVNASMGMSFIGVSHSNLPYAAMGITNNFSVPIMPGLGSWSTNSAVLSTASLQLASISSAASQPLAYFQIMRFA